MTRKNSTKKVMTLTTDKSLREIFISAKALYEALPEVTSLEFDSFMTNDFRTVQSFQAIQQSSSLRDLKNAIGTVYSKIKFYICCKFGDV